MTSVDLETGLTGFFEQDHRDCDARWADVEELLDTADIESARVAWQKYDSSMRRHIAMEEEVVFPAFVAKSGIADGGPIAVMKAEHLEMIGLLEQIDAAMQAGDAQLAMDIGDNLLMLVQQHNAREEDIFYPMAKDVLAGEWENLTIILAEY